MTKADERSSFSGPHRFVAPEDNRLGAALGAGHMPGSGMVWAADTAARARRGVRCAVCGKEPGDPVHLPPD